MATRIDSKVKSDAGDRETRRNARLDIEEFHAEYAATLERGDVEGWCTFFTENAVYKVIARDNADSGLPLGLIYCEGRAMMEDRAFAILNTEMFAPRYIRHRIANTRILAIDGDEIRAEAGYMVLETGIDEPTRIQQVGRYHDVFVRDGDRLLLRERTCIYDTVLIDNCLVYPV